MQKKASEDHTLLPISAGGKHTIVLPARDSALRHLSLIQRRKIESTKYQIK